MKGNIPHLRVPKGSLTCTDIAGNETVGVGVPGDLRTPRGLL